jgi:hypothetical protein
MKKFTESIDLELDLDIVIDFILTLQDFGYNIIIKDHSGYVCYKIFSELENIINRLNRYGFFVKNLEIQDELFSFPYKMRNVDIIFTNMK